jgi:hypothetical protein
MTVPTLHANATYGRRRTAWYIEIMVARSAGGALAASWPVTTVSCTARNA